MSLKQKLHKHIKEFGEVSRDNLRQFGDYLGYKVAESAEMSQPAKTITCDSSLFPDNEKRPELNPYV